MAGTVRFIFRVPRSSILGLYLVLQRLSHLEDSHHGASGRRAWSWSLINVSILRNTNPPSVRLDTVKCVRCGTEVANRKVKSSSIGFNICLAEYQRQINFRIEIDTWSLHEANNTECTSEGWNVSTEWVWKWLSGTWNFGAVGESAIFSGTPGRHCWCDGGRVRLSTSILW